MTIIMIVYILLSYFPSFIEPCDIKLIKTSDFVPEIQRLNDTFILVNYLDSFDCLDFSQIQKIEFYQRNPDKHLAVASSTHKGDPTIQSDGILVQQLLEGQDLLAKIDPCAEYLYLYINVEDAEGAEAGPFKFSPSMFLSEINRWLCYEDDESVHLSLDSPENILLRSCAQKFQISQKMLSEGINQDIKNSEFKNSQLRIIKKDGSS